MTGLLARVRSAGLTGEIGRLPRFGEVVMVRTTPFHAEPVHLVDELDLAWLLAEISNEPEAAPDRMAA